MLTRWVALGGVLHELNSLFLSLSYDAGFNPFAQQPLGFGGRNPFSVAEEAVEAGDLAATASEFAAPRARAEFAVPFPVVRSRPRPADQPSAAPSPPVVDPQEAAKLREELQAAKQHLLQVGTSSMIGVQWRCILTVPYSFRKPTRSSKPS